MMSDPAAFTRREFLGSSLAIVSTTAMVPAFLQRSAQAIAPSRDLLTASQPGIPEDRVLVIIELNGGNDGLNTVIPFAMPQYYRARPSLAVREDNVLKLSHSDGLGLHPRMAPIRQMLDEGHAAIIQGVGYPNPNRSHFTSRDIWHTADTSGSPGQGWIGRALDISIDPKQNKALSQQNLHFQPIQNQLRPSNVSPLVDCSRNESLRHHRRF